MKKTITAILDSRTEADRIIHLLEQAGVTMEQTALIVSESTRDKSFDIEENTKSDEGAVAGAAIGGLTGALYLGLATAGTLFVPGLNLIVSGAVMGSLAGLGAGATIGAVIGGIVGQSIPEHEIRVYESGLRKGHMLLAVSAVDEAQAEEVEKILRDNAAQDIKVAA